MERRTFLTSALAVIGAFVGIKSIGWRHGLRDIPAKPFKLDTDLLIAQLKEKHAKKNGSYYPNRRPDLNPQLAARLTAQRTERWYMGLDGKLYPKLDKR
jgi:hypothetical protein